MDGRPSDWLHRRLLTRPPSRSTRLAYWLQTGLPRGLSTWIMRRPWRGLDGRLAGWSLVGSTQWLLSRLRRVEGREKGCVKGAAVGALDGAQRGGLRAAGGGLGTLLLGH